MNRPTRASVRALYNNGGGVENANGSVIASSSSSAPSSAASTSATKVSGSKRAFDEAATVVVDDDVAIVPASANQNDDAAIVVDHDDTSTASTAAAANAPPGVNPEDANSCAVCLDRVIEQGLLDSCAHVFCFSCAKKWSESENTCPLCKQRFHSIVRVDVSQLAKLQRNGHPSSPPMPPPQLSNPNQKRRAEKIRVAQRNQSSRNNAAALLGPGMFLSSHMRAIVRLLWPGLAGNITSARHVRMGAPQPQETIDVEAMQPSPPPPPPPVLPRLVRGAVERPQIIDLTDLDSSDSEEANAPSSAPAQTPTIDLTLDDDDDDDANNTPHDDLVSIPLVSQ